MTRVAGMRGGHPETTRLIDHRGPRNIDRLTVATGRLRRIETVLPAGNSMSVAVADLMRREGCRGGTIALQGGLLEPFRFVVPAEAPSLDHAVWYSADRSPEGGATIEQAVCTVGRHDGATFVHCHGTWRARDGALLGGHLLPDVCHIVHPVTATAWLSADAWLERTYDAETNFQLFAAHGRGEGVNAIATVRPGEEIGEAIGRIAHRAGIRKARVYGLGSLADIAFADGSCARSLAHEVLVTDGQVTCSDGVEPVVDLAIAGVGTDGVVHAGTLSRDGNLVAVTFELVLKAEP